MDENFAYAVSRFVFSIPGALSLAIAAPMLCAGLTVYSLLVNAGVGLCTCVGVVGLGSLGHFAVMYPAALGLRADVTVMPHSTGKKEDALKMGAKEFVPLERASGQPHIAEA